MLQELDSYSFNPHKWMLTNFDCCALWTADAVAVKEALSLTPVFLQVPPATEGICARSVPWACHPVFCVCLQVAKLAMCTRQLLAVLPRWHFKSYR